ncbi:MAG: helix-turn-helix domain-containing protein [Gordonia sp. (in: high G+C Gram-positive bacteria)]
MRDDASMPPTPRLDRDTIVDAALSLIERDGIDALSMRRLATELDSKPMSLYHYVPNKAELLALVLDELAARISWSIPDGSPRDRMIGVAMEMYTQLLRIPWIITVLREGRTTGRSALILTDSFLAAAGEAGLDRRRAFGLWRASWDLVASEVGWQYSMSQRPDDQRLWFQRADSGDLAADYPTVAALLPEWSELSRGFDLREVITDLIDGALAR